MIEILDPGAHDHADAGAVEHDVERNQRHRDDAEQRQAVGRIEHEAERGDPDQGGRGRNGLRQAAEEKAHGLHEHDAKAEGHQQLVLVRPGIEVADDHALHHHADQHDEQRTGDDGDDKGARIGIGDPAGVAAEHEHRAVGKVEDAERAVDDGQAGGDQRQKRPEHHSVEDLRDKIGPVDHAYVRGFAGQPFVALLFGVTAVLVPSFVPGTPVVFLLKSGRAARGEDGASRLGPGNDGPSPPGPCGEGVYGRQV